MEKTNTYIERLISKEKAGELVFISDFAGSGTDAAIRKSLSRLAQKGKLRRIAQGIYYIPKTDPLLGELYPSAEEVARKVAEKERVHIHPTGIYAMNKLGLSTQVPMKLVYLTDGVQRLLTIGKVKVKFKATTRKKLSLKGEISRLVILALEEMDTTQIDFASEKKLRELLRNEDPKKLKHDLSLATGKVHDYIVKLLKTTTNDGMAKANE